MKVMIMMAICMQLALVTAMIVIRKRTQEQRKYVTIKTTTATDNYRKMR